MRKEFLQSFLFLALLMVGTAVSAQIAPSVYTSSQKDPCLANAGGSVSQCGLTATIDASQSEGGIGTWSYDGAASSVSFDNPNSAVTNVTASVFGVYVFTYTIDVDGCFSQDNVIVEFGDNPSPASAGADDTACGLSYTLSAEEPSIGYGSWSGDGTFSSVLDNGATVTVSDYGTYAFAWIIYNCNCEPEIDTVYVTFTDGPDPSTSQSAETCGLTYSFPSNVIPSSNGAWDSMGSGVSFSDLNDLGATITAPDYGTYNFQWTESDACGSASTAFTVEFNDGGAVANAGGNVQTCANSVQLNGNAPFVGSGMWTGPASFDDPTDPNATASLAGLAPGVYTFTWTVTTACDSDSDDVNVTILDGIPTVDAGESITVCGLSQVLGATKPEFCGGLWSSPDAGVNFSSPNFPNSTITVDAAGTYTLVWSVFCDDGCEDEETIEMTFVDNPSTANAGADFTDCGLNTQLAAINPVVGSGMWSSDDAGVSFANDAFGSTMVSVPNFGTYTFTWTVSTSSPCPATSDEVTVTFVNENVSANAGANDSTCDLSYNLSANDPAPFVGAWSANSSSVSFSDVNDPNATVSVSMNGTYTLTWTVSGDCSADADQVTISMGGANIMTSAGNDATICEDSYTLNGSLGVGLSGTWSVVSGTGVFADANSATTTVSGLSAGANTFMWTVTDGGCSSDMDEVTITQSDALCVGSIGDFVWYDADADGVQDAGEMGIGGVEVTLVYPDGSTATTTTDGNGFYVFTGLEPGDYEVIVGAGPAGYSLTTGGSYNVSLGASENYMDADFGFDINCENVFVDAGDDVTICAGNSADLTASGSDGMSFSWGAAGSGATVNVSPFVTTTFTLTGTDADGCTATDNVTVFISLAPDAEAGDDVSICDGESVTLTASGGGTYFWNTSSTEPSITVNPIETTTYSVTVTTNGCSSTDDVTVFVGENCGSIGDYVWNDDNGDGIQDPGEDGLPGITVTLTYPDGSTETTTTDANGNYDFTGLPSGLYTVTVGSGPAGMDLTTEGSFVVPLSPNEDYNDADFGFDDPCEDFDIEVSDDITVCEGEIVTFIEDENFVYTWSFGAVGSSVTYLPEAGETEITVIVEISSDKNDCVDTDTFTIFVEGCSTIGDYVWYDEDGDGVQDADEMGIEGVEVTLVFEDGTTITTTTDENGNYLFEDLYAGDYTVIVGDGPDGTSLTTVGSYDVTLGESEDFLDADFGFDDICGDEVVSAGDDVTICAGESATLTATGSAGTITWTGFPAGDASITVSPSTTTTYTVTITTADNCTASDEVTVFVNPNPTADAGDDVSVCEGETVTLTASGGVSYNWMPGNVSAESITVSDAGTYTVTVTDENGCTDTDSVEVSFNDNPDVDGGDDVEICEGETATLTASGADSYTWMLNGEEVGTGASIEVDEAGTYIVMGESAEGCDGSDEVEVTVNPNPTANAGADVEICEGDEATLTASGAGAGGSYQWVDGPASASWTVSEAGTYTVTVTDANGCTDTDSVNVTFNDDEPPFAEAGPSEEVCGLVATMNAFELQAGTTGEWIYFAGGLTFSDVTDPNATVTADDFGVYVLTWVVSSECGQSSDQVTITFADLPSPAEAGEGGEVCGLSFTLNAEVPTIGEGYWSEVDGATFGSPINEETNTVTVDAYGTYVFTWNTFNCTCPISMDEVTVTFYGEIEADAGDDAQFCSEDFVYNLDATTPSEGTGTWTLVSGSGFIGSPNDPNALVTGLAVGDNVFEWTVDNGPCSTSDQVTITVHPGSSVSAGPDVAFCEDQDVVLTASDALEYQWYDADGNPIGDGTQSITVMEPGTYTVVGTNEFGCDGEDEVEVSLNPEPTAEAGDDVEICEGEEVTLTASGGGDYLWNDGTDTASMTVSPSETTTYSVTVINEFGCTDTDQVTVAVNPNPEADAGDDVEICDGEMAILTGSGGVEFLWSNGEIASTITVVPSETTTYTLTVTNEEGCTDTDEVTVIVHPNPTADAGDDVSICDGGSVMLTASGGGSYEWSTNEETASIEVSPTVTTTYMVTVTTDEGCTDEDEVTVFVNNNPEAEAGPDQEICEGETATLTASGGGSYEWSTGEFTQSIEVTTGGTFTVTVTDGNGCTDSDEVEVTLNPNPEADAGDDQEICEGETATLTASGGGSYEWSTDEDTQSIEVTAGGVYTVTVTNEHGCTDTDQVEVIVNPNPVADAGDDQEICEGETATLTASGGGTYEWSTGETTASIEVSTGGTFVVTVTNEFGCMDTDEVEVILNPNPEVDAGDDVEICDGETVTLTATADMDGDFMWNTGSNEASIEVAVSGTFTVTFTNEFGCTDTDQVTVTVNPNPNADAGPDQEICEGETATLTASGGGSYLWSTGETTASIEVSPSQTTTYMVTVTNEHGCTDEDEVTVFVNPNPEADAGEDQEICEGETATLTASGGGSYEWSTGEFTQSIEVTTGGTFTVTVTNEYGCTDTDEVVVTLNPNPEVDAGEDQEICDGETATLTATADMDVDYLWNTGETTASIEVSNAGLYTVTVTNEFGCMDYDEVEVIVNPNPEADAGDDQEICQGETATLTATGGGDYMWSTGETTATIEVEAGGVYSVTVTNEYGCTDTDEVEVIVNPNPDADAGDDQEICEGETATLTASGGGSYLWSTGETTASIEVSPSQTTTYMVTVTNEHGCTDEDEVTVFVNPNPVADAGDDQEICEGEMATLTASGGGSYLWSTGETTASIEVGCGTFSVTVTNEFGCTDTDEVTVICNPNPEADAGEDQEICEGETATLTASGGGDYEWSTGETTESIEVTTGGTFTVTVTNEYGCTDTDEVVVTINPNPEADAGDDQEICDGETATLTASGGGSYLWSTGETTASIEVTEAGIYTVTVTNEFGCTDQDQAEVIVNPNPVADAGDDQSICLGESANLTASGGGDYMWSTGEETASIEVSPTVTTTYMVTVTNEHGCTDEDEVTVFVNPNPDADAGDDQSICDGETATLTATGGGTYEWSNGETTVSIEVSPSQTMTYMVTVTNEFGCEDEDEVTVFVNPNPVADAGDDQEICDGETATLTASGGGSYLWSTGETTASIEVDCGTYSVTVTNEFGCTDTDEVTVTCNPNPEADAGEDQEICEGETATLTATGGGDYEWSTGETTASIEVTTGGTFSVTVINEFGCEDTDEVVVTVNPLPTADAGDDVEICDGGITTLTASGGVSYLWSTGATSESIMVTECGVYTVTVTDENGCSDSDSVEVICNPNPVADAGDDVSICDGETATLTATGGGSYLWSTGETTASIEVGCGTYTVTVTNEFGCEDTDEVTVTCNPNPTANAGADQSVCAGETTTITATGGGDYSWSNGSSDATIEVGPGTYTVTVTNEYGCTDSDTVVVDEYDSPTADAGDDVEICDGGITTLTATGGVSYQWSTGAVSAEIMVTECGVYTVTVTDENGCTDTDSVEVICNPNPDADAGDDVAICEGETATLTATGGGTYEWSTGETTASIEVGCGTYTVTVTNEFGCESTDEVTVTCNPNPVANAGADQSVCAGETTTITATGGGDYEWSDGLGSDASIEVGPGTYTVTVTNQYGCTDSDTVEVFELDGPTADAGDDVEICDGDLVTLTASGGGSYQWSTGAISQSITVTTCGVYTVTVTDENGCTDSDSVEVICNPEPVADAGDDVSICEGEMATLTASGGETYEWSNGMEGATIEVGCGTYEVTVTNEYGCEDTDVVVVICNDNPAADAGDDEEICEGDSVTLTASGGASYQWVDGPAGASWTVSPTETTTYTVTVMSGEGCSDMDEVTVFVNPNPTADAGSDATICAGDDVTLTASGGSSYQWTGGPASASWTVNPTSTTTYTVIVSNGDGCTDMDEVTVFVTDLPDADAGDDEEICEGDSVTLTASGGGTYNWSTGDNTASITVSPSETTTYTVTVTNNNCSSTDEVTVIVNNNPLADAGGDVPICLGESHTLTASGGGTYEWSTGEDTSSITVSPTETTEYTVTVTNEAGCEAIDYVTVVVNPLPVAVIAGAEDICQGESVTLVASGGVAYQWLGGPSSDTWTVSPLVTTTYTVTVLNEFGCEDQAQVTINVNEGIDVEVDAGDDVEFCGMEVNLTATISASGVTGTWTTEHAGVTIFSPNSLSTIVQVPSFGDYTFTYTVEGECTFASDDVTITFADQPSDVSAGSDGTTCGLTYQLGAETPTVGTGVWSGPGLFSDLYDPNATVEVFSPGEYTFIWMVNNCICPSSMSEVTITFSEGPEADAGDDMSTCPGNAVTLTASGGSSYSWSNGMSGASIVVSPNSTTVYTVTVSDGAGCTATDDVTVFVEECGSIGDTVFSDSDGDGFQDAGESGIAGIMVTLTMPDGTTQTTFTDANGNYEFTGLPAGNYIVTVGAGPAGSNLTTAGSFNVSLGAGEDYDDADFGYQPGLGSIGDFVWLDTDGDGFQDAGENGIAGVEVTLTFPDGSTQTTTTDANGNYLFDNLMPGSYIVTVGDGPDGSELTSISLYAVNLGANQNFVDADFGFNDVCTDQYEVCTQEQTPVEICLEFCDVLDAMVASAHTTYNCSVVVLEDNCIRYTPLPLLTGLDTITVIGCNLLGECDTVYVNVYIGDDCPIGTMDLMANNDAASTHLNTDINIPIELNDNYPVGSSPSFTLVDAPINGTVSISGGNATYSPNDDYCGADAFTYELCANGECDLAVVTVTVVCPKPDENNAPVAGNDFANVMEGSSTNIFVLPNDSDPDGDNISITGFTQPTNGTVTLTGSGFEYTPNAGFCGATDMFTYQICDDGNPQLCDVATVSVNVTCLPPVEDNTPPVAVSDNVVYDFLTPYTIDVLANDYDPDGDNFMITEFEQPAHGTVTQVGDNLVYTPNEGYVGNDAFTYTICDDGNPSLCAITVVYLTSACNDTNTPPVAVNDSETTPMDTPVTISVLGNDSDPDGDVISVTGYTDPSNGTVTQVGGSLIYTPDAGFCGVDSFDYVICDDQDGCDSATVTVTVECPTNNPPIANDDSESTAMNTPVGIDVLPNDSDPDGDVITITTFTQPANGTVSQSGNTFVYIPSVGFCGVDMFTYTICDSEGACDSAEVTVTVDCPTNEPPVANNDGYTTDFNTPITFCVDLNDSDPDGDAISVSTASSPSNGSYTQSGNCFTYTPNNGFSGTDVFTYTICDPDGLCDDATVSITVLPEPPSECESTLVLCTEPMTPVEVCIPFCDVPGAQIASAVTTYNCSITILEDNCIRYTPLPAFTGMDTIRVIGCDLVGNCDTTYVEVHIGDCNGLFATDDDVTTPQNEEVDIDIIGNDGGAAGISIENIDNPINGTLIDNGNGTVTYVPSPDYIGTDYFTYTITDAEGNEEEAIVYITVLAPDSFEGEIITESNKKECEPSVPNAFTPNFDGTNDVFRLQDAACFTNQEIRVFNQTGKEVYRNNDRGAEINWDGRTTSGMDLPEGTYYFIVSMTTDEGEQFQKTGFVELRR